MVWNFNLLVTAVPLPGVTRSVGHEIGGSLVLHSLRESQQNPDIIVCSFSIIGGAENRGKKGTEALSDEMLCI